MSLQVLLKGVFNTAFIDPGGSFIFITQIIVGVSLVGVLIGLITGAVGPFIEGPTNGSS